MIDTINRKRGFRKLTTAEIDAVSGGVGDEIFVDGKRFDNDHYPAPGAWTGLTNLLTSLGNIPAYPIGQTTAATTDDIDGDGVPDNEDSNPYDPMVGGTLFVNGPPRLATNWDQLTLATKVDWLAAWAFSGGEDLYADIIAGTNLSGNNPNDPYASIQERLDRYGEAGKSALESALAPLSNLR